MKTIAITLLVGLLAISASAKKKEVQVTVVAAHSVANGTGETSFNLDAIIDQQHVALECGSDNGCPSVAPGDYSGYFDFEGSRVVNVIFPIPLSTKTTKRWYTMRGSW